MPELVILHCALPGDEIQANADGRRFWIHQGGRHRVCALMDTGVRGTLVTVSDDRQSHGYGLLGAECRA